MQKKVIFLSTFFFFSLIFNQIRAQEISVDLIKTGADSLFKLKKYTDAKILYDDLYFSHHQQSDDLLIKLAYINEGLKKPEWSIFFLEKYLKSHPKDDKIVRQIEHIATKNNLRGYTKSDIDEFIHWFTPYKLGVILSLLAAYITYAIYYNIRKKLQKSIAVIVILGIGLFVLFYFMQKADNKSRAIITQKAPLMDQPSAGGNLLETITPGHKVIVLDKVDIWSHILLEGQEAYILSERLINL